jgi:membrane protease subunit HflK
MPWKEPGKGDKDPWKSGDQQPPDLEEVFKNVSSRVRSIFGGGSGSGRSSSGPGNSGVLPLLILLILFWAGWDAVHILDEAERGVVMRFGKYSRTLQPGINLTMPRPIETLTKVNVTGIRSVEDRGHMLTEDENLVDLNFSVQYRVSSAEDFLFKVREPEDTLHEAMESALRESVGTNNLDFILGGEGRLKVGIDTEKVLQETLDRYNSGIQITKFNLKDATVPAQVRDAFADVNKAREDRQRFIEEAQVHVNSVIPEARGAAARIIQEAVGYRDSTIALAEGEADRFSLLMAEYQMAPAITRKRLYLQTMENVLSRSNKVLLDVDSSGNVLYLPLGGDAGRGASALMPPLVTPNNSNSPQQERASGSSRNAARESRR